MLFTLLKNEDHLDDYEDLDTAISDMELAFAAHQEAEPDTLVTFTVKNDTGQALACKTNRRITATIYPQFWGGPNEDVLSPAGAPVKSDVTAAVLMADPATVVNIQDYSYCSDWLKDKSAIIHDGPFDVVVEESLCQFFGVDRIGNLTPDVLEYVKAWCPTPKEQYRTLNVAVALRVKADSDANLADFANALTLEFINRTPGTHIEQLAIVSKQWDGD